MNSEYSNREKGVQIDTLALERSPQEFASSGYVTPYRISTTEKARMTAARVLSALESSQSDDRKSLLDKLTGRYLKPRVLSQRTNRHFDWRPIAELASAESLLALVRDILGEEVVLWRSNIFVQNASRRSGLPWHRDIYPKLLRDANKQVSVQLALTDTTPDNCLEVLSGSHRLSLDALEEHFGLVTKNHSKSAGNVSFKGSQDSEPNTRVVLSPGECILFAPMLLHRSSVADREVAQRVCITFRYTVPENVTQVDGKPRLVLLSGNKPKYDLVDGAFVDWRAGLPEHLTDIE